MDLLISIILVILICFYKNIENNKSDNIEVNYINEEGECVTKVVQEDTIPIGTNLYLKREDRAFCKIVDEMGL